jgi:16S rRNA (cytidine1402-2'-O)-methyltransferase
MPATVYLIPTVLSEGQTQCLPAYLLDAVRACKVFFVEEERTARRFLKLLWKEMVIDDYGWHNMKEDNVDNAFRKAIRDGLSIGIISEAGCPAIADPGQQLVAIAQEMKVSIRPLVGPSSIILALMASGMNGQRFEFLGYLPIEAAARVQAIKNLESTSRIRKSTEIFIETPYRNNQMMESLLKNCQPQTRICVACNLTAPDEWVRSKTVTEWKKELPQLHKIPAIFLLLAESD